MKSTSWKLSKEAHAEIVSVMSERARIRFEFKDTGESKQRLKQLPTGKQLAEKYGVTEQAVYYHAHRTRIAERRKLRAEAKRAA